MPDEVGKGLVLQFIDSARTLGATVETTRKNAAELNASLLKATADDEAVLFAEPDRVRADLFEEFLRSTKVITKPTKEQLALTPTGVTDAFCAIASTGSVCVSVSKNLGGPVSFLTQKHIAVVDAETIVSRPRDVFSWGNIVDRDFARSFSIITGPSATADMGPLVIGVHGPGQLHIIILE